MARACLLCWAGVGAGSSSFSSLSVRGRGVGAPWREAERCTVHTDGGKRKAKTTGKLYSALLTKVPDCLGSIFSRL